MPLYSVLKITSAIFLLQFMFSSSSDALERRFSAQVIFLNITYRVCFLGCLFSGQKNEG